MRKILIMALAGMAFVFNADKASAQDDVFVDLSVLNDIGGAPMAVPMPVVRSEPLFPVVKSAPKFPVVSKSATKPNVKKAKKTTKPSKASTPSKPEKQGLKIKQLSITDKIERVNIPAKPKDINAGETELKTAPASREFVAGVNEPKALADNGPFGAEVKAPTDKVSSAPVVGITSEVIEAPVVEPAPIEATGPSLLPNVSSGEQVTHLPENSSQKAISPLQGMVNAVEESQAPKIEPLIPVNESTQSKELVAENNSMAVNRQIIFAEGSSELDELSKEKVSSIIASFDDAKINKIAILAYNYDNGQDVFKKKRQSLNRAIEIRSFLLTKGYKNFSIKVININDDASKGNVVEIDEIK